MVMNSSNLTSAISFATEVHRAVTRKGKDTPYITHPLAVALILARVTDNPDIITAAILHDTIEDCKPYGSVTRQLLSARFGKRVAELVDSVTEQDKSLPSEVRKAQALAHMDEMDHDMLLLKSADILHNLLELLEDIEADGEKVFLKFNVSKEVKIKTLKDQVRKLQKRWPGNPLLGEIEAGYKKMKFKTG